MTAPRLLVIDDDANFAALVQTVAEERGFLVTVTDKGEDFKSAYMADPPSVIVLDIVMPEIDGIELMKWLAERGCQAQVVIVSGYDPSYARAAKAIAESQAGMTIQTLEKPVKLADLRAAISAVDG